MTAAPVTADSARLQARRCTVAEAAREAHVSVRYVYYSKRVLRDGVPELVQAIKRGDHLSVYTAYLLSHLTAEEQREALGLPWREQVLTANAVKLVLKSQRSAPGSAP